MDDLYLKLRASKWMNPSTKTRRLLASIFLILVTLTAAFIYFSCDGEDFWNLKPFKMITKLHGWKNGTTGFCGLFIGCLGSVVAGNLMQYTTRNKLASPFTMGILPATTTAALITRTGTTYSIFTDFLLAVAIAMAILFVVVIITKHKNKSEMIVVGLAIGMVVMGMNAYLAAKYPDGELVSGWFSGFGFPWTWEFLNVIAPIVLSATVISLLLSKKIQAYKRNPEKAKTLGIRVNILVITNYFLAAVLSVGAVTVMGEIAFIGMAIPNLTRIIFKSDSFSLNAIMGMLLAFPLVLLSVKYAGQYGYNFHHVATIGCAPVFILAMILQGRRNA